MRCQTVREGAALISFDYVANPLLTRGLLTCKQQTSDRHEVVGPQPDQRRRSASHSANLLSCDPDPGGNDLQNFPVIASAVSSGGNTTIEGSLNSQPRGTFTLDFYVNDFCDGTAPNDFGEGRTFVGSKIVTTDNSCIANFTGTNAATFTLALTGGKVITATA